jgi:Second Messenger Oligonucleotide or Dinucleotide Synthetase domain
MNKMETLPQAFRDALTMIGLGPKRARAIKAHEEVRDVLARDETLKSWGVSTVLIGSYGRETAIYPGKDVDVFVKLPDGPDDPEVVFQAVKKPLIDEYTDRVTEHRRSLMIDFPDDFSVDAVPAIPTTEHWRIPAVDEDDKRTQWEETDPERLGELTHRRNDAPLVDGNGVYVPTVKLIRQIRRHHLADATPAGLYFELESYWAFDAGVTGDSQAEILGATLDRIAAQLESADVISDPALGRRYNPAPDPTDLDAAAQKFRGLATKAGQALAAERCPAAVLWREILGKNDQGWVFALPDDCDEQGKATARITPIADKGSREARPFA